MLSPTVRASPAMIVSVHLFALEPEHLDQEPDLLRDMLGWDRIGEERPGGAVRPRADELQASLMPGRQRRKDVDDRWLIRRASDPQALRAAGRSVDRG